MFARLYVRVRLVLDRIGSEIVATEDAKRFVHSLEDAIGGVPHFADYIPSGIESMAFGALLLLSFSEPIRIAVNVLVEVVRRLRM
jgi:hypothetical protein